VIQRRDYSRFLLKAGSVNTLALLDRDDPFEPCVTGRVHLAHSARADAGEDFVRPELVA
jgi:hypothetical protein